MPALSFPPFPDDVPTHPLFIIDFALLKERDPQEMDRLLEAGSKLGFWYLKNHGVEEEANQMFDLGQEVMEHRLEEQRKLEQGASGYKPPVDNHPGKTGTTEKFVHVSKDDVLAWPERQPRSPYPQPVERRMPTVVQPFIRKSEEVNQTILTIFNDKLGLPEGYLSQLHPPGEQSLSEARILWNLPMPHDIHKIAIGEHTDYGTLTFLHNRLGGLQVLPPGAETWQYVKPIPNHAICNVGDSLAIFSGGILRSNMHRVLPPPGAQSAHERWSLVYFTRVGNSKIIRALAEASPTIANAVAADPKKFETGLTAKEFPIQRGLITWQPTRGF